MAGLVAAVHCLLYLSVLYGLNHTALFFHFQEELPGLFDNGYGQVLDIIGTSGRVYNAV